MFSKSFGTLLRSHDVCRSGVLKICVDKFVQNWSTELPRAFHTGIVLSEYRGSRSRYGDRNGDRNGDRYLNNRDRGGYGNDRFNRGNRRNARPMDRYSRDRRRDFKNDNAYDNDKFEERSFPALRELSDEEKIITNGQVADSKLNADIRRAFTKNVGETFTATQEKSINYFISNSRGIIVRAKTGTGKTLAFGLPIFQSLKEKSAENQVLPGVDSIIFAPTRDLAVQTKNSLTKVWKDCKSKLRNNDIVLVTGKVPLRAQLNSFRTRSKPPIVVATPGRFIDLLQNEPQFIDAMKNVSNVVIDEADELLNQNFKQDLETIFKLLQENSVKEQEVKFKTFLFSATMSNNVYELADQVIGEGYEFVDANDGETTETNHNIKQSLVVTKSIFESYASALQFIRSKIHEPDFKPMIFLPNTVSVDFFHDLLMKYVKRQEHVPRRDLPQVLKIHGKLTQGERNFAQREFRGDPRRPRKSILVGSNVVSRGMDFPNVSHVIQIGVNPDLSNYTHRVGRTGRAGKEGHSLLIATDFEIPFVKKLIEHGNSFEEELEYQTDEAEEAVIRNCAQGMSFDSISVANLGIYNMLPAKYGPILKQDYVRGCGELYQDLHENPDDAEKPYLSRRAAQMMGLDSRLVSKYFDLSGSGSYDEQDSRRSRYSRDRY